MKTFLSVIAALFCIPSFLFAEKFRIEETWTLGDGLGTTNIAAGPSIIVDDDFMFVGDQERSTGGGHGKVYVFTPSGDSWALSQTLEDGSGLTDPGWFGYAISRDGNWLAVSSTHAVAPTGEGDCQMFELVNGQWVYRQYIQPEENTIDDEIISVTVKGDWLVLGSPYDSNGETPTPIRYGAAFVYKNIAGTWTRQQMLQESPLVADNHFALGTRLETDSELFVGSYDMTAGYRFGVAYRYTRSGDTWSLAETITPAVRNGSGSFGGARRAGADWLLANEAFPSSSFLLGKFHFMKWTGSGWDDNVYHYTDTQPKARFPMSVSVSDDGTICCLGSGLQNYSDGSTDNPNGKGRVDVFRLIGGAWRRVDILAPAELNYGDWFGVSTDIHDGDIYVLAGSRFENGKRNVKVYRFRSGPNNAAVLNAGSVTIGE